jgi:hypothetical protein
MIGDDSSGSSSSSPLFRSFCDEILLVQEAAENVRVGL